MTFLLASMIPCLLLMVAALSSRPIHTDLRLTLVCQGLLIGVGAYSYGIAGQFGVGALGGLIFATIASGVCGVGLVSAASRVVGDDFALVTFAIQVAGIAIITVATPITGGVLGIAQLPPLPFSPAIGTTSSALALLAGICFISLFLLRWYQCHELSRVAVVVGRSRELALTHGLPVTLSRALIAAGMGCLMGSAGAVFAGYLTFIEPQTFSVPLSVLVLAGVLLLHISGPRLFVVGVVFMTVAPEALRLIPDFTGRAAALRDVLAGFVVLSISIYAMRHREA